MTWSDMLVNSTIVSSKVLSKRKNGLNTPAQKIRQIIFFILTAAFTIYTKFILKTRILDVLTIALIVNLISLCYLAFTKKSVYAMNHASRYKALVLLNKVCKLVIFADAMVAYVGFFDTTMRNYFGDVNWGAAIWDNLVLDFNHGNFDNCKALFEYLNGEGYFIQTVSCLVNIVLAVPAIIYLLIFNFFYLPPMCIYTYFNWLFGNSRYFYEYISISDTEFRRNKRRINLPAYALTRFLIKLAISIATVGIICLTIWGIYYFNLVDLKEAMKAAAEAVL